MKYYANKLLSFDRNPDTILAILKIFDTLTTMNWDAASVYSIREGKVIKVIKHSVDIIKVDFDYSKLYDEYVLWLYGHPDKIKLPIWALDAHKTELFLKCLKESVLYYLPRKDTLFSPFEMEKVLDLYLNILRVKPDYSMN